MAKAKIQEKHSVSVEGTLNIKENDEITMEVEDIGEKKLSDLLNTFNGKYIKIAAGQSIEIE